MRNQKRKLIIAFLLSAVLCIVIYGWNSITQTKLTKQLEASVDLYFAGEADNIDLTGIGNFQWDNVYIFGQYADCVSIVKTLNAPYFWFRCETSGIENIRGISLFVFTRNGVIVGVANPWNVPVGKEVIYKNFSNQAATFVINENGYLDSVKGQ